MTHLSGISALEPYCPRNDGGGTTLSLDPGFRTGWAVSNGASGVFDVSHYDDHGQALAMWHDWLDAQIVEHAPSLLAIERAVFSGRFVHADFTSSLIRWSHAIAWSRNIRRTEVTAVDVRYWLTGSRKATDRQIRAALVPLGFATVTEHAGDAAALLCCCEQRKPKAVRT